MIDKARVKVDRFGIGMTGQHILTEHPVVIVFQPVKPLEPRVMPRFLEPLSAPGGVFAGDVNARERVPRIADVNPPHHADVRAVTDIDKTASDDLRLVPCPLCEVLTDDDIVLYVPRVAA